MPCSNPRRTASRARATPPASPTSPTSSRARRELPRPARRRGTSWPSPTLRFSARWPRCKDSPASSAWTRTFSAAPWGFPPICCVCARMLRAAAADSSPRLAQRWAGRSALSPARSSKFGDSPLPPEDPPMPAHWIGILTAIASAAVQFVLFLRWLHRRMRNEEIVRAFVRDIATNHLPHIYNALQKIAAEQGIELDDTPLVRFVDLNGHRRR